MKSPMDARQFAESLIGRPLSTPTFNRRNVVLSVRGANVQVATDDSPDGEDVPLRALQTGLDLLLGSGEVRIAPETFDAVRRSSFVGAALRTLHGTVVSAPPTWVRLAPATPLRDQLIEAAKLVKAARTTPRVTAVDPLQRLMVHELPNTLRAIVGDSAGYKVQGSAGQMNFPWAETPWVAVFDRLVTESAQRGHYVVLLIDRSGERVIMSLMLAVAEARAGAAGSYLAVLRADAIKLGSYLEQSDAHGLLVGPLDVGAGGARSRGYEAGSVVAAEFPVVSMPHDVVIVQQLRRFLALYEKTTAGLDADQVAVVDGTAGRETTTGTEAKRYRWHLRAEGRNRTVVRKAKELRAYRCGVCRRDFVDEFGEIGKRCVDAHHLTPFAELDKRPRELDPATDFAVVCSNCHRLLHSETPPLLPEDLAHFYSGTES